MVQSLPAGNQQIVRHPVFNLPMQGQPYQTPPALAIRCDFGLIPSPRILPCMGCIVESTVVVIGDHIPALLQMNVCQLPYLHKYVWWFHWDPTLGSLLESDPLLDATSVHRSLHRGKNRMEIDVTRSSAAQGKTSCAEPAWHSPRCSLFLCLTTLIVYSYGAGSTSTCWLYPSSQVS